LIIKNPNYNTISNTLSINSNNTTSLGSLTSNKKESNEITNTDFDNTKSNSLIDNIENENNKNEEL